MTMTLQVVDGIVKADLNAIKELDEHFDELVETTQRLGLNEIHFYQRGEYATKIPDLGSYLIKRAIYQVLLDRKLNQSAN